MTFSSAMGGTIRQGPSQTLACPNKTSADVAIHRRWGDLIVASIKIAFMNPN
jgi:hypothetical protein